VADAVATFSQQQRRFFLVLALASAREKDSIHDLRHGTFDWLSVKVLFVNDSKYSRYKILPLISKIAKLGHLQ
jgi:hypothetical protein